MMDQFTQWLKEIKRSFVGQPDGSAWVHVLWRREAPFADRDMIEAKATEFGLKVVEMRGGLLVGENPIAW